MESENNLKKKQKLEVSDILKAAIIIYVKNFNFMIFTFLTSLPLFCIMVYFEIQLQETIVETFHIVNSKDVDVHHSYTGSILDYFMNNYYYLKLIQLGLIYIFPLHVLEFGTAIITVDLASKLGSQQEKKMTLKVMFEKSLDSSKLRGSFLTFIYVVFLTTTHQLGLLWIVINCYFYLKDLSFVVFALICSMLFAKLLKMYLEWSSIWNTSLVISILEGIYGIDALVLSLNFSRGCQRKGLFLMLIFFAWGQFLRFFCYYVGGYEQGNGIFIQVGLFCMVIPLKWVVFMIYFHDCKERYLEKKMDEELGKDVRGVSE
ncbi:hypothetical protein MtrunA17_Chr8g0365061 [Medicago truncatula]|uniref:Transmembrane protein n=1 Tax=Medicago truncatula TaxID=3880 RepID=A0A396GJR1_MEDTR|nr:uncharacterized protein LOC25501296 isoform X1 [Medicago truncatula]RHN41342.1 hypothetical protein MtrunA17_Chr8g0365061 [Medicago truncatula]